MTLIMYNMNYMIFSNLCLVKEYLKMDQGGVSIHRINKLSTLKPSLTASVAVLTFRYNTASYRI